MNGRNLIRRGARRRVRTRTALFLCLFGAAGIALLSALSPFLGAGARPWISLLGTLLFYALPAYLGLYEMDGDQTHLLMKNKLSGAQASLLHIKAQISAGNVAHPFSSHLFVFLILPHPAFPCKVFVL